MFADPSIEIWNLSDGGVLEVAPQSVVPIVGRIRRWTDGTPVSYSLDDGPAHPVVVGDGSGGRLARSGDFGIDSLTREQLSVGRHRLRIQVDRPEGVSSSAIDFEAVRTRRPEANFRLDLTGRPPVQSIGQVIDGRWTVDQVDGEAVLRIAPGQEGYDRIVLFGDDNWSTGYRVDCEFTIDRYAGHPHFHAFGPVFKWRPHVQGDGHHLPRTWTSGLGLFSASLTGLCLRYGTNVTYGENGKRTGNTLLGSTAVSRLRRMRNLTTGRLPLVPHTPEFPAGRRLRMQVLVDHGRHEISIEPSGWRGHARRASLVVPATDELVPGGAVGFLAAYCALRIHRYDVTPVGDGPASPGDRSPDPQTVGESWRRNWSHQIHAPTT